MSGPVLAERSEEREERMAHVILLPEEASPTGIAL